MAFEPASFPESIMFFKKRVNTVLKVKQDPAYSFPIGDRHRSASLPPNMARLHQYLKFSELSHVEAKHAKGRKKNI